MSSDQLLLQALQLLVEPLHQDALLMVLTLVQLGNVLMEWRISYQSSEVVPMGYQSQSPLSLVSQTQWRLGDPNWGTVIGGRSLGQANITSVSEVRWVTISCTWSTPAKWVSIRPLVLLSSSTPRADRSSIKFNWKHIVLVQLKGLQPLDIHHSISTWLRRPGLQLLHYLDSGLWFTIKFKRRFSEIKHLGAWSSMYLFTSTLVKALSWPRSVATSRLFSTCNEASIEASLLFWSVNIILFSVMISSWI